MSKKQIDIESILVEALRRSDAEHRRAYLEAACGIDTELRAEIDSLVCAYEDGKVVFGVTVIVADEDSGEESTYQIVGEDEADIKQGKISYSSPIARGLIGKSEGDVALVKTPGGDKEYEILEVKYL